MILQHAAICLRLFLSSHSLLLCSETLKMLLAQYIMLTRVYIYIYIYIYSVFLCYTKFDKASDAPGHKRVVVAFACVCVFALVVVVVVVVAVVVVVVVVVVKVTPKTPLQKERFWRAHGTLKLDRNNKSKPKPLY